MNSLYEYYIKEDQWNYYSVIPNNRLNDKLFVTTKSSLAFIKDYFKEGGKESVIKAFDVDDFDVPRADHTVSLFFLGVILLNNTEFKNLIFFPSTVNKQYDFFPFIWFLVCLSHDAAFHQEKNKDLLEIAKDIKILKKHLNIEHDLFSLQVKNVPASLLNVCEQYFLYRHEQGATDHGIHAGILLYDRLVKNRIVQKEQGDNSLEWHDSLDDDYAFAAATIATHNIWFPKEKDFEKYREYGLENLIDHKKVNSKDSPLLYLLGIIDTIEPVKAYWQLKLKPK
ncbi:MAG TPA: hypothetical protein VIJ27_05855, partial [Mucilaginibacter sp.]